MPTPIVIDGFEHQVKDLNSFSGTYNGLWDSDLQNPSLITFPSGRNGVCMQIAPAGASTRILKYLNDPTVVVASFYIRTSTTPASASILWNLQTPGYATCPVLLLTGSGTLRMSFGGNIDTAGTYNDGNWHRVDLKANVSANPWTLDWQVDGAAQTAGSISSAANSIRYIQFGTGGGGETWTCQYDDFVVSATSGDYPLGAHDVLYGVPTGDGTHVAGTNTIEDNAGTDIVSPNAFPLLDDMASSPSTDYIMQSTIGTGNYAEVTFADVPANKTIWGVEGYAALFSSGVNVNDGTTRIVDSAGTSLTNIYAGDMSETSLHYRRAIITAPGGGWTETNFNGLKARVGFSSDVTDVPRWAALMLQYAVIDAPAGPSTRKLRVVTSPLRW
jgi:hypothetical protein